MGYPHKVIIILVALTGCWLYSCTNRKTTESLDRAESLIESTPDSALTILTGIDRRQLAGEEQRARYALLMSMALDKNYIDTTAFDVLQPAIDYYLYHGTPDEKLRTYYYHGRIYQNAGHRDSALNCFTRAIDISPQCRDSLVIARALVAQGRLYYDSYDCISYKENYIKAANIYNKLSYKESELDCLINAFNGCILTNDRFQADSLLQILQKTKTENNDYKQKLEGRFLAYAVQFGNKDDIQNWIKKQGDKISINAFNALDMAIAYNQLGDNDIALEILNSIKQSKLKYDTLKYEAVAVNILKDLGNYRDAFLVYWDYSHRQDSINAVKFDQKSRAIKEKHAIELKAQIDATNKSKIIWWCIIGLFILTAGVFILLLILRSNKTKKELALERVKAKELENANLKAESERLNFEKERLTLEADNLAYRVEKLEEESDNLKKVIESKFDLPKEVTNAIKVRIEMLNSLLASRITENDRYETTYDTWVKNLTLNIYEFMNSNRLAFKASHPHFIQYFYDHGLTDDEINYVCLYAIGLNGKEVGNYMKKPSHVNMSSAIRRKLGLDKHETNLGIYVRNILKNL